MTRTEQDNGKNEKKTPAELLKEFIRQLLVSIFKKELTQMEFDPDNGKIGKKLVKLREGIDAIENDPSRANENSLEDLGKLFRSLQEEIDTFRQERDAVTDPKSMKQMVEKKKSGSRRNDEKNKLNRLVDNNNKEADKKNQQIDEIEAKPQAEKERGRQRLAKEVPQEMANAQKEVRDIDRDAEAHLTKQAERIKKIEESHSLQGKSGLFNPEAAIIKADFAKFKEHFREAIRQNPQMASLTLEQARKAIVVNLDKLGSQDYASLLRDLGELEQQFARPLANARAGINQPLLPTDEQISAQRRQSETIIEQINQGNISTVRGIEEIQAIEGMSDAQNAHWQRMLDPRRRGRRDGGFWAGVDGDDIDRGMEMYGRSADMQYRLTREQIRKEYKELSPEAFEDYINRRVLDILATGRMSRDYSNTPLKLEIEALLDSEEVLDPKIWGGINREQRENIRDRVYALLGENDFALGVRSASREQIMGAAKQVGMDNYREALKFRASFDINYQVNGEARTADDKSFSLGELVELTRSDHFGKRALDTSAEVRSDAQRDMVLYLIASKLEGWHDIKIGDTGLTDFSKLSVREVDGGFEIFMQGAPDSSKFIIQGYKDARGDHNIDQFLRQTKGMARMSQDFAKADQSLYIFLDQLNYNGDFNDADAKYFWLTYARRYGVPLHHKIIEAIYPKRGDLVSETYHKALASVFGMTAKDNRELGVKDGDIKDLLEFMLKNEYGALMTPEMILKNWQALIVDRRVSKGSGKTADRFAHLSKDRRKKLDSLLKNVLENEDFDWSRMIKHFVNLQEGETIEQGVRRYLKLDASQPMPSWFNAKGVNGFRAMVMTMNRERMYDTLTPWHETDEPDVVKGGSWKDDRDKHYDYMFRISKGFAALLGFAENPNWENRINAFKSGAHDFMTRSGKAELIMNVEEALDETHNTQWSTESYVTDENNALEPLKDANDKIITDEEGKIIYQRQNMYLYKEGRRLGVPPKPAWIRKGELDQMRASGYISYDKWVDGREKYLEHVFGIPLSSIPGLGRVPFIKGFDPFGWVPDNVPILSSFKQQFRWGLGPMIGNWRIFWSEINKKQLAGDLMGEWGKIFGQEMKQVMQ